MDYLTIDCRFQPWCLHCPFSRSDGTKIPRIHKNLCDTNCPKTKADFDSLTTSDCSVLATRKCSGLHGRPSPAGRCARNRQRRRKKRRRRRSGTWSSFARRSHDPWIPSVSSGSSIALTGQFNISIHCLPMLLNTD